MTRIKIKDHLWGTAFIATCLAMAQMTAAQSISLQDAERQLLQNSYSTQAAQQLQQAAQLQAEASKGLGLPRVDLNLRAYRFHSEVDVPLDQLKNNLENTLSQGVSQQINQWEKDQGLPLGSTAPLEQNLQNSIHGGIGLIPDKSHVVLDDHVVRPTVSVMMPLYSGGLIQNSKAVANLQNNRSQLDTQQQQDLQRFELIQSYFNVQLQKALLESAQFNFKAMQQHYRNALKMEQQGFISKGQRMQFEVNS